MVNINKILKPKQPKPGKRASISNSALEHAIKTYHKFHNHTTHIDYLVEHIGYSRTNWQRALSLIAKSMGPRVTGGLNLEDRIAALVAKEQG